MIKNTLKKILLKVILCIKPIYNNIYQIIGYD